MDSRCSEESGGWFGKGSEYFQKQPPEVLYKKQLF